MRKYNVPFEKISDRLFSYVSALYQEDQRFPYPLQRGQKGALFGTVFACFIAFMLGREKQLPGRERICEEILLLRNPETGLFVDPELDITHFLNPSNHSPLYVTLQTTYFCYACLHALGVPFDRRLNWLTTLLEEGQVEQWLEELDWRNPWLVSNLDMFVGIFLLEWLSFDNTDPRVLRAVDAYFRWHYRTQVPQTGFWGSQGDLFNAMAGAYHIILHYDYLHKHINFPEKIIDATLSLAAKDGLFVYGGGGGSCEDMDAIDILVRLSLITDYRQDDVKTTLLRSAQMLATGQSHDGGFCWRLQPNSRSVSRIPLYMGPDLNLALRVLRNFTFKLLHVSHYCSTHYYSGLSTYPYRLMESDMWSSWFRALSLAFIAKRYANEFTETCNWKMPSWPGLGYDPFISEAVNK